MTLLRAVCVAFATYSRIPMPNVEWNERNLRYSLCFFPLVGAFVGASMLSLCALFDAIGVSGLLKGAAGVSLTLLITGGIHMDGLMDTADALGSHADREKKLLILKDSRVGAFGAISCALYMLTAAGALGEPLSPAFAAGYVISRALAALLIVVTPGASAGFLKTFRDGAALRAVTVSSALCVLLFGALAVCIDRRAVFALAAVCALALYHRRMAIREFGGMTGDLAGWLIMMAELVYLIGIAIAGRVIL